MDTALSCFPSFSGKYDQYSVVNVVHLQGVVCQAIQRSSVAFVPLGRVRGHVNCQRSTFCKENFAVSKNMNNIFSVSLGT